MTMSGLHMSFPILVIFLPNCAGLTLENFSRDLPDFLNNFEQIVIIGDSRLEPTSLHRGSFWQLIQISSTKDITADDFHPDCLNNGNVGMIIAIRNGTELTRNLRQIVRVDPRPVYLVLWSDTPTSIQETLMSEAVLQTQTSIRFDSKIFWIFHGLEAAVLNVWETYSVKSTSITQKVSPVTTEEELIRSILTPTWHRRRNFHGVPLIATAVEDTGFDEEVKFVENPDGSKVLDDSLAVDIYRMFRDLLNFSEMSIQGEYMMQQPSIRGKKHMHLQLQSGEADMSISLSTMIAEKAAEVHFLPPLTATWLELRFKEPTAKWSFFTNPFNLRVWLLTIVFGAVMVTLVTIYQQLLCQVNKERALSRSTGWLRFSVNDVLWIVSTFCLQGWHDWPSSHSVRMLFVVATITGFLVNAFYMGALTSQLSVKQPTQVTLEKLLDRKYSFYIEEDMGFPIALEMFPEWSGIQVNVTYDAESGLVVLGKILAGSTAMISSPELYWKISQFANYADLYACQLCTAVRVSKTPSLCAMAVNRTSEFKEIFTVLTLMISERGIRRRLYVKYKRRRILICRRDSLEVVPQALLELSLAFAVVLAGLLSSVIIYFIQNIWRAHSYTYWKDFEGSKDKWKGMRFQPQQCRGNHVIGVMAMEARDEIERIIIKTVWSR